MSKIKIFGTEEKLFKAAADLIVKLSEKSIAKNSRFTIALSGGHTPKRLYELLAETSYARAINWKKTFVFWSDERCVPQSSEDNNSHMASLALLNNVRIPAENIFPVPVNFQPAKAAVSYEQMIRTFFKEKEPAFDLVLLGLGDDGHTASLFPGNIILQEKTALVKEVFVEEKNTYRVTFTVPLINNAKNILFLVTGEDKSRIVRKVFLKPAAKQKFPAQLINPTSGNLQWFIDKPASELLND